MRTFYFNSGIKPWNASFPLRKDEKFINNELHLPFYVDDIVPENAMLNCLCNSVTDYDRQNFIVAEVRGGNMHSKYAVFYKPWKGERKMMTELFEFYYANCPEVKIISAHYDSTRTEAVICLEKHVNLIHYTDYKGNYFIKFVTYGEGDDKHSDSYAEATKQ